jgi:hypothetical protein
MKRFVGHSIGIAVGLVLAAELIAFGLIEAASAQEKQTIAYKSLAANSKFTQQHVIDVGDVPGHQIRIYEHHRTFPMNPPVF